MIIFTVDRAYPKAVENQVTANMRVVIVSGDTNRANIEFQNCKINIHFVHMYNAIY